MNQIQLGNAPCSWGSLEFNGLDGQALTFSRMLDELHESGFRGTELGDWGFMPTDPETLRYELQRRDLTMTGAFVPVALADLGAHADGERRAVEVAKLIAAVAGEQPPFLVLADANGTDLNRTRNAGRISAVEGLPAALWPTFARGAERIARSVREATGLRTVFHHHCAGFIETPEEIARLLELTDPALLGLVFDTGHYIYGAGTCDGSAVLAGLQRFAERIWYVHFKDCQPEVARTARSEGFDYFEAVARGVFCELGQGSVDFAAVLAWLREHDYRGWITVEQDVLPGMGAPRESARRNRDYLAAIGL